MWEIVRDHAGEQEIVARVPQRNFGVMWDFALREVAVPVALVTLRDVVHQRDPRQPQATGFSILVEDAEIRVSDSAIAGGPYIIRFYMREVKA